MILSSLALFKRFGWSRFAAQEAIEIYEKIVHHLDPAISRQEFTEVVQRLRRRKVLQGESTLYITPKLLHVRLWRDWWEQHSRHFVIPELYLKLSQQLRDWFGEMIQYARESRAAFEVVQALLRPGGPFGDGAWFSTEQGARLFFYLAQVEPQAALWCLENSLGLRNVDQLRSFRVGRRDIVRALEWIAQKRALFADAAELLLRLAEAENETWGNNASGIFADLFSLGHGRMAPTEAPPSERLHVLEKALTSGLAAREKLALDGYDRALQTRFVRMGSFERQGLRKNLSYWAPKTWGEVFDAYRLYWRSLLEVRTRVPPSLAHKLAQLLLSRARELCSVQNLREMVLDTLDQFAREETASLTPEVLKTVISIIHYDHKTLGVEITDRLEKLRDRLTGADFGSLLRRYAGMDLLEDRFNKEGEHSDQVGPELQRLALMAVEAPQILISQLDWLVAAQTSNSLRFGEAVGARDIELSLWQPTLNAWTIAKNSSDTFIAGYLRSVCARDPNIWEHLILQFGVITGAAPRLPDIVWRSGYTPAVGQILTRLARENIFPPWRLKVFSYGGAVEQIDDPTFEEWIRLLVSLNETRSALAALELCSYRTYGNKWSIPNELLFEVLSNRAFFRDDFRDGADNMADYHWVEQATKLVDTSPSYAAPIAELMLCTLGEDGTIFESQYSEATKLLGKLAKRHPKPLWATITKHIGPPAPLHALAIFEWLRGLGDDRERSKGALADIPRELIWAWVAESPTERAPHLARFVPKEITVEDWPNSRARELLIKFGAEKKVRRALDSNYFSEGWWGPASAHYTAKLQALRAIAEREADPNARLWLDENIGALAEIVERERAREERED